MSVRLAVIVGAAMTVLAAPTPVAAQRLLDQCTAETCVARLSADDLLREIEALIAAKRFAEARPMLAALAQAPQFRLEARYLNGQLAAASGDHAGAAEFYKAILADDPSQTRVRLDLAREMMQLGQHQSADRQFRIAMADEDLPPDIARTIRSVRDVIRANRAWRFDVDFGLAPDTNINNATQAYVIDIAWGGGKLPLTLDSSARAKSGTGLFGTVSTGVRLPVMQRVSIIADLNASGTEYAGADYDSYQAELAIGPELRPNQNVSFFAQALVAQNWYGDRVVSRQGGAKGGFQAALSDRERVGVQIDLRNTNALADRNYDGWQGGVFATYERAIARSLIASGGVFARRDWLRADAYSSTELGVTLGFGGELPHGISLGASGTASRARFDAPLRVFSDEAREDWRFNARATLGNRKIRVFGFSPQVNVSHAFNDSSLSLYRTERTRVRFALARYF